MSALAGAIETGTAVVLLLFGSRWLAHGVLRLAVALPAPTAAWPALMLLSFVAPMAILFGTAVAVGEPQMAVGGVIGAQLMFLLLGQGVFAAVPASPREAGAADWRGAVALVGATILFLLVAADGRFARWEGVVLLLGVVAYLSLVAPPLWFNDRADTAARAGVRGMGILPVLVRPVAGLVMLALGAVLMVEGTATVGPVAGLQNAAAGALLLGPVIGVATMRALFLPAAPRLGTDAGNMLPFLATALMTNAAIVAVVSSADVPPLLSFDMWVLAAATVVVLLVLVGSKPLSRIEAAGLIGLYVVYLATLFEPVYSGLR